MFDSDWLDYIPGNSLEGALSFLNELSWNIKFKKDGGQWKAFSGDRLLIAVQSKDELDSFIFGMTIALAVIPDSMLDDIKKLVAE